MFHVCSLTLNVNSAIAAQIQYTWAVYACQPYWSVHMRIDYSLMDENKHISRFVNVLGFFNVYQLIAYILVYLMVINVFV